VDKVCSPSKYLCISFSAAVLAFPSNFLILSCAAATSANTASDLYLSLP